MEEGATDANGVVDAVPRVTFLYTYAGGPCPKSYGLNVARLARLPESVIKRAGEKSAEFERACRDAEEELAAAAAGGGGGGGDMDEA